MFCEGEETDLGGFCGGFDGRGEDGEAPAEAGVVAVVHCGVDVVEGGGEVEVWLVVSWRAHCEVALSRELLIVICTALCSGGDRNRCRGV